MTEYEGYVKIEVMCRVRNIKAKNEKEAKIIAAGTAWNFIETARCEHINDDVFEIEDYNLVGNVEVYKQEEEEE